MSTKAINGPITKRGTKRKKEITPEHHERLKRIGYQKGTSGNPAGRPPDDPIFKQKIADNGEEIIEAMLDKMRNSRNEMVSYKATEWLGDKLVAKAPTKHEVEVTKNESFTLLINMMEAMPAEQGEIIETPAAVIHVEPEDEGQ